MNKGCVRSAFCILMASIILLSTGCGKHSGETEEQDSAAVSEEETGSMTGSSGSKAEEGVTVTVNSETSSTDTKAIIPENNTSPTAAATEGETTEDTTGEQTVTSGYISSPNTNFEPVRTLDEIKSSLSSADMTCDSYDLDKYTTPYWKGNIMYNESLNFIEDPRTGVASAPLLYDAAEILSVKNSALNITYEEGVDYTYADGKITLTENSRIHCFKYSNIYFSSGNDNNRWALKSGFGYLYTYFCEGTYFHENQIAVTYLHSNPWTGYMPDYEGDNLPNVISKLENGEDVKIVFYGDSITKGGNASGMFGVAPNMPIWADMVVAKLKETYPNANITSYNPAANGTNSAEGLRDCKVKVADQKPDLVIIGYGMNDGSDSAITPDSYKTNISGIIQMVKAIYSSSTDFILISTTLPNQEIQLGDANMQADYEPKLYELEKKGELGGDGGVIVANMTEIHEELLKTKRFFDMTANNVNHPNDFLVRAEAQCVLSLLIKDYT